METYTYETTRTVYYPGAEIVWYLAGLLELLLLFRFALKLLGANPAAGFTDFIYRISYPFVAPFINVFTPTAVPGTVPGSIFEWTTLLAMLVYWLVAVLIMRLFLVSSTTVV